MIKSRPKQLLLVWGVTERKEVGELNNDGNGSS
jgi:hypothetical protein